MKLRSLLVLLMLGVLTISMAGIVQAQAIELTEFEKGKVEAAKLLEGKWRFDAAATVASCRANPDNRNLMASPVALNFLRDAHKLTDKPDSNYVTMTFEIAPHRGNRPNKNEFFCGYIINEMITNGVPNTNIASLRIPFSTSFGNPTPDGQQTVVMASRPDLSNIDFVHTLTAVFVDADTWYFRKYASEQPSKGLDFKNYYTRIK